MNHQHWHDMDATDHWLVCGGVITCCSMLTLFLILFSGYGG